MKTGVTQTHVNAIPGLSTRVDVDVTNTSNVIDGITAIVDGINPDWVRLERPMISLFPEATERLTVVFDIPRSCPAGDYLVVVRVVSTIDSERFSVHDFWLTVGVVEGVSLVLRPSIVTGGAKAAVHAIVTNTGNATAEISVDALEPTRALDCRVDPNHFVLGHGAEALLPITLRGPRPWIGQPASRQIHITVRTGDVEVEKVATFHQRPRIARGLITALVLAGIVLLWALIFLWVVTELRTREPVAKATGTDILTGPENIPIAAIAGSASGTVTAATTGAGIPRITVESWRVDASGKLIPVGSAATDEDGRYEVPSLIPGNFRLRFSASGFDEVWYADDSGSDVIAIAPRQAATGLDVTMVGAPGRLTGRIALPPGSAAVPLTVTATMITEQAGAGSGAGAGGGAAPVTVTQVTTDGNINLEGLPTPATFQVTVTGQGFDTQSFQQAVGGGEASVINTVSLGAASGSITGGVTDANGVALGGVNVVARSGNTEVRVVTPTSGDVGRFSLVGLATPATYVLTFELTGFSSQTLALNLDAGASQSASARLVGGSGTISGDAQAPDATPIGGIPVRIVGEGFTAETTTLTTNGAAGAAGSFTVAGLPVPGDYTITLGGGGFQAETLSASFTEAGTRSVGAITLLPTVSEIRGTVFVGGNGIGEAIVSLTNGIVSQQTTSATNPAGAFAFAQVPEGAYTLTVERPGFSRRVVLVEVAAGDLVEQNVSIVAAP